MKSISCRRSPVGTFFCAASAIPVQWSAVDLGSGVQHYDVEYQIASGDWTPWFTATTQTQATFSGTLGVAYTFRVRATDNVSNTSAWAQAEAKTVVVKKYYTVADQRVAMRENGVLYYLHTDHLGSASLTTDASGDIHAQQRYFPYGETRWSSAPLPTDRQFTGQRREAALGIYDYKARFYSPRLGRFLNADTVVPGVESQALNRYIYANENPLRYSDPSGYLSEDEIMRYLGVSTWDEVLALFAKGQVLEGRWGWLETLRQAELGDEIRFHEDVSGLWPSSDPTIFAGRLVDKDGKLYIQSGDELMAANDAAWLGNAYSIWRSMRQNDPVAPYSGPLYAEKMYLHLKFDPNRVDWVGAGIDAAGIAADFVSLGLVGRAVNIAQAAVKVGKALDVADVWWGGTQLALREHEGTIDLTLSRAGFFLDLIGGVQPIWPDALGLALNLGTGFYWTP